MPTNSGDPRLVTTHSPGKNRDLNANANAPSWKAVDTRKGATETANQSSITGQSFMGRKRGALQFKVHSTTTQSSAITAGVYLRFAE